MELTMDYKLFCVLVLFIGCQFAGSVIGQDQPHLQVLPKQDIQRKPVGHPSLLTCQAVVPNDKLVTDLQWKDPFNRTINRKEVKEFSSAYMRLYSREKSGQKAPLIYTELLPGNQGLALMITSMTEQMAGTYYCTASYANTELLTTSVKIETFIPITWKDAPPNQYANQGSDYLIKCEVTANPSPTVDWLMNGDPIETGDRFIVEPLGLKIRDVQGEDDGTYTCRAAVIQTGELNERNINLEVLEKPKITSLPVRMNTVEGHQFSAFCNATGKPVPNFTWIRDLTQENVANADRFIVNPVTGQLNILRVEKEDYGNYTCRATNKAGYDEASTLLNVLLRPRIYEFLNVTVPQNDTAVITCKATGRPPPKITFRRWGSTEEYALSYQKDDERVELIQTGDFDRGESSGTLTIQKLLRSDDGLYECVARNEGDSAFKVGHITVEYPPNFDRMKNLPPVFSWEERIANVSCLAEGFPNATIEWYWRGRPLHREFDQNIQIENRGPQSNLLIKPLGEQYYSAYKCIATNRHGRAEHDIELKRAFVPNIVGMSSRPREVTATSIRFEIIPPGEGVNLPVTAYTVQYKDERNPDWATAWNRTWSPDSTYIVEGLRPQTMYNFRFAARNLVGLSQFGAYVTQATPIRSYPETPRVLHAAVNEWDQTKDPEEPLVVSPYSDRFELRWAVPPDNGEPIDHYQVKFCPGSKTDGHWNEFDSLCRINHIPITEPTTFELTDLDGDTYYRIELRAHNAIGYSRPISFLLKTARGSDVVLRFNSPALSSAAIVGIAVGGILLLLIIIDLLCCIIVNAGILASICRRAKRSPSDLDEEAKLGSLYGWRFPLPYCSGQLVKEPPPSPLPLPPPVKLGSTTPSDERQPLNSPGDFPRFKSSTAEFDGRVVHSRSGDIIGKNSAV